LSPIAKPSKSPNVKKIEIKNTSKPNLKADSSCLKPQLQQNNTPINKNMKQTPTLTTSTATNPTKLQKLFKHLTKSNPQSLKILSPDYINLKGMDRGLLC